jgi:hypothetical protein
MLTRIGAIYPPVVEDLGEKIPTYGNNGDHNNDHNVRQRIETLCFKSELVVTVLTTMRVPDLDIDILSFGLARWALLTQIHIGTRSAKVTLLL